MSLKNVNTGNR